MEDRNLKALLCKIIFFYSVFYVVMKIIAVVFEHIWAIPNLILAVPFAVFVAFGGYMLKQKKFYWVYVIAGVVVISAIRYYETRWVVSLHQYFS